MRVKCSKPSTLISACAISQQQQQQRLLSARVHGRVARISSCRIARNQNNDSSKRLAVVTSAQKRISKADGPNKPNDVVQAVVTEPVTQKSVFVFGAGRSEGDKSMKMSLGGKGANLAEMSSIGLSVPPGFTITTDTCEEFHLNGCELPKGVWESVVDALKEVESMSGKKFGDSENPLLVSVRSGAAVSMPGMMDTVLNLGLNDSVVQGLAKKAESERFAYDSYRRFIDMFGDVVLGIPHSLFEHEIETLKQKAGVENDNELSTENLKELVEAYKNVYVSQGLKFPEDPLDQLKSAIFAVFNSWNSDRAIKFRAINKVSDLKGTAVNIQTMVFGNMGPTSGTGVCFTRNPSTGENLLYGEYLINAQGEDVVAGIRTPEDIMRLKEELPEAFESLIRNCEILEGHYRDMQDIEFTVEDGKLWMLQTRSGKRTGKAAVKIAADFVDAGVISEEKAITMVEPTHLDQLLHPQFEDENAYKKDVLAKGLPASPGAAVGTLVFNSEDTEEAFSRGEKVILVRVETSPEDVGGMYAAAGILTARGGMTSHAAVVARGWGKCCISGCSDIIVDESARTVTFPNGTVLKEGDSLSLNGSTGEVILGRQPMVSPEISGDLGKFMSWVDKNRDIKVLANADTPDDAALARKNGAEGIGLVRTEHMFFGTDERIAAVRQMIMATTTEERQLGLDKILPFQRSDFIGIFEAMDGLPVTIRLLDPPLHEFLPEGDDVEVELAALCGITPEAVLQRIESMIEVNPMLGFRGCRLAITYPEIAIMQARAIMEAACDAQAKGIKAIPDIMIPLVGTPEELSSQKAIVIETCEKVLKEKNMTVEFKVGTMIEVPRAALCADEIATHAEFFSFGTNDLTQMTFGFSRDDVAKFLPSYLEKGILKNDPFEVIDQRGVGQLIEMATQKGRATKPGLKVGVCGEQGGEPSSVEFFHRIGLDYVSCSAFRVPIARLAAAQAKINAQ